MASKGRSVGLRLAAALLRTARGGLGPEATLQLRLPPTGAWGSFDEDAISGTREFVRYLW
jgi:hypothetical protein